MQSTQYLVNASDPGFARQVPMPDSLARHVWRGDEPAVATGSSVATGWSALDDVLPGGGWPRGALSEILAAQPSVLEWRVTGVALGSVVASGGQIALVAPPKHPHLPGLAHAGIDQRHLLWLQAESPAERLWVTEQLIKSRSAGAIVAWLPQARQEQIRRLQVCAGGSDTLIFLCRPEAAEHEASAAPLRIHATFDPDWALRLRIVKRRGSTLEASLRLPSVPGGLDAVLTPRIRRPSHLTQSLEIQAHVVGRPAPSIVAAGHAVLR